NSRSGNPSPPNALHFTPLVPTPVPRFPPFHVTTSRQRRSALWSGVGGNRRAACPGAQARAASSRVQRAPPPPSREKPQVTRLQMMRHGQWGRWWREGEGAGGGMWGIGQRSEER